MKKFEILKNSFKTHRISARVHGNKGSKPSNALYSFAVMRSDTKCLQHLASVGLNLVWLYACIRTTGSVSLLVNDHQLRN